MESPYESCTWRFAIRLGPYCIGLAVAALTPLANGVAHGAAMKKVDILAHAAGKTLQGWR